MRHGGDFCLAESVWPRISRCLFCCEGGAWHNMFVFFSGIYRLLVCLHRKERERHRIYRVFFFSVGDVFIARRGSGIQILDFLGGLVA